MCLRLSAILAVLALASSAGDVLAITCEAVFSNAVGTTGKKLEIKGNASLTNTSGGLLATGDLKTDNGSTPCDAQACSATGTNAPALVIPSHNTTTDSKGISLTLAPGDYYFDKLEFDAGNTVVLTGSGQVRIHVANKLKIEGNVQINVNGDPLDLIFLVAGDVEIKNNAQVNAIIYSNKKVRVRDNAVVRGAIVGKEAKIENSAIVDYTSTGTLEIDGVCAPAIRLDHLRLLHDGFGLVGVAETITVQACANADCSLFFTSDVDLSLVPSDGVSMWSDGSASGSTLTISGGQQAVYLDRSSPGSFNIGATANPAAPGATRCFIGASESCAMNFVQPTLSVTLPDQVSGATSSGSVSLSDCWPDFQSTSRPLEFAAQYVAPLWLGPSITVNGVALPTDGSGMTLNVTFDSACVAPLQVEYAEAGEIAINAAFTGSGALNGLAMLGGDSPVFYPAMLELQAVDGAGMPLNATAPGAVPIHAAGNAFALTVSARNASGAITQGYQPEASDRIRVFVERTGPLTGFDGAMEIWPGTFVSSQPNPPAGPADYAVGNVPGAAFTNGVYTQNQATYAEVGLITLYLRDSDYMGHAIDATPLPIGRFVPAHFEAGGALVNRNITPGCAGDSFSYMGEQLRLQADLIALNAANVVTRNYQGNYASFTGSGLAAYSGSVGDTVAALSSSVDLSSRLSVDAVALGVPWGGGMARLDVDLRLLASTAPDGPYDATEFGLAFSDNDGVGLQGLDMDVDGNSLQDHRALATGRLRFGRAAVGNAHGSELLDLDVPVVMQYFAGSAMGFEVHSDDTCTTLTNVLLSDADTGDSLVLSDTCIIDDPGTSGSYACPVGTPGTQYRGVAQSGRFAVSLRAPGAARTGSMNVDVGVPTWAQFDWSGSGVGNPRGIATFGIYSRENGVIYQRELR